MIYFDNAATGGRKPDCVMEAVSSSIKVCANPGRSGHKLSLSCAKIVQECRDELDAYFGSHRLLYLLLPGLCHSGDFNPTTLISF